jgi:hypothetical protein
MRVSMHPDFRQWIERETSQILRLVDDLTDVAHQGSPPSVHPDTFIRANLKSEDVIGEVVRSHTDVTGRKTAHFWQHGDKTVGLSGDNLLKAQKISERIWSRREIRDFISAETIEDLLLDWIGAAARGRPTDSLAQRIDQILTTQVTETSVWVPIDATVIEGELQFADCTLMMLSRTDLDNALDRGSKDRAADILTQYRRKLHRDWAGKAIMSFSLCAEDRRARELALEKADKYMTLLQFYSIPARSYLVASHAAPLGYRPYRMRRTIAVGASTFRHSAGMAEPSSWLYITSAHRTFMEKMGLMVLSSLAQGSACEYEEKLLNALLIYGRACYQFEPLDKLLQIMTAMEMFALGNSSEQITGSVADRLAFAIADPAARRAVAQNFREVYEIRSRRSHHGRHSSDVVTIEKFLENAWTFFLRSIQGVGWYRDHKQFLDYLEGVKYGHHAI